MINIIVVKVDKSHFFPVFVSILSINEGVFCSVELLNVPKNRLAVIQYYQYTASLSQVNKQLDDVSVVKMY